MDVISMFNGNQCDQQGCFKGGNEPATAAQTVRLTAFQAPLVNWQSGFLTLAEAALIN